MTDYKYALRYSLEPEFNEKGFTKNDRTEDQGLCDSLIVISILTPPDGSYSQGLITYDGKTQKGLSQDDIFKAWSMLGMSLFEENDLTNWKKAVVENHALLMKRMMKELTKKYGDKKESK